MGRPIEEWVWLSSPTDPEIKLVDSGNNVKATLKKIDCDTWIVRFELDGLKFGIELNQIDDDAAAMKMAAAWIIWTCESVAKRFNSFAEHVPAPDFR